MYKPDEKLIFAKAIDQAYYCIKKYKPAFTDFLDPYKTSELLKLIGNNNEFNIKIFGGTENCERNIIGFFPEYIEINIYDFPISAVKIKVNTKFCTMPAHKDFLGSIIGLGITREKTGDIIINENKAFVFVKDDILDYICCNLDRVGNTKVQVSKVEFIKCENNKSKLTEQNIISSSLRIDTILSAAFKLSRSKASEFILSGKVYINWILIENVSKQVNIGDVITLRGCGRIKILDIEGKTKKDRIILNICKYT